MHIDYILYIYANIEVQTARMYFAGAKYILL